MISLSVFNFGPRSFLGSILCLLLVVTGRPVEAADFVPSPLTRGMKPLVDLTGEWSSSEGKKIQVPFADPEAREMQLSRWLRLPEDHDPGKQLYLYLEGLSWTSEIYWNDHLLKVSQDPFAEHLLPIENDWIHPAGDQLRIHLSSEGADYILYPEHFLGIHRGVFILESDKVQVDLPQPEVVSFTSKAVVLAPWSESDLFLDDVKVIKMYTEGLFSIPKHIPICLPFRPSNAAYKMLGESGIPVLFSAKGADSLAFYNYYPLARKPEVLHPDFWRGADLRPGKGYGSFQNWEELRMPRGEDLDRFALLSLLLLPVLGMLAIRIGIPRVYDHLPEYLSKTKIYLELIGNNKYLKTGQRYLMNFVRITVTGATISLFLYYLNSSGDLIRLNIWSEESLLYGVLSGNSFSALEIMGMAMLVLVIVNMLKYLLLNMAGGIFRLNNLAATVQALDIFASFPLNLLPLVPLIFIFFVDSSVGEILLIIWYVLFLVYLIRRFILIYAGLSRLFSFSASMKFLYICSLEILPWVLLL